MFGFQMFTVNIYDKCLKTGRSRVWILDTKSGRSLGKNHATSGGNSLANLERLTGGHSPVFRHIFVSKIQTKIDRFTIFKKGLA